MGADLRELILDLRDNLPKQHVGFGVFIFKIMLMNYATAEDSRVSTLASPAVLPDCF